MRNRRQAGFAAVLLFVTTALVAQQPDRVQTEALSRRAADRLATLHAEADRLASDERTLLGDLRRLEVERQIRLEGVRQVEQDAAQVERDLGALNTQVATLQQQERDQAPRLRARLVSLYKLGQGRYVRLLFSTTDVRQIVRATRTVAALASQDRADVARHQARLVALEASRGTLEERRARLAALRANAVRAGEAAAKAVEARNRLITDIDEQRDLNARLSGELQGAQQRLQQALASATAGGAAAAPTLPIQPFRGDLDWPVTGTVRQEFGRPARGGTAVNGIDLAAAEGTPVHAIHDGTVMFAGPFAGYGRLVIVDHGGQAFSLYGNLREETTTQGQRVTRGQPLGTVGVATTGATGLYFELRIDGRPVDPLQWLRKP